MKHLKTASLLTVSLAFALAVFAEDAEKTMSLDKLPAPAAQALQKASGGARIESLSEEKDEGKIVYEAKFTANGQVQEVSVDAEGRTVSVEKVIALADAPEPVRKTIEANADGGGTVEKVEHIQEGDKVTYETLVSVGDRREEIVLSTEGKVTARENKGHEKKEKHEHGKKHGKDEDDEND